MEKHLFPLNYKYQAKFLGIIEYRILLPICIIASIVIFFLYILRVDFFISFGIIVLLLLPAVLLLSIGVNGQPTVSYLLALFKFSKAQKVYIYEKRQ